LNVLSTPSLGITRPPRLYAHAGTDFQLPLSGSRQLTCPHHGHLNSACTFNSLSRDHEVERLRNAFETQRQAFNSLSRDHRSPCTACLYICHKEIVFQLPLSGSPDVDREFILRNVCGLSTPSLGITDQNEPADVAFRLIYSFNSLSRDHGSPRGKYAYRRNVFMLSTPSLGITLFLFLGVPGRMTGLRPFNSLSRDHH